MSPSSYPIRSVTMSELPQFMRVGEHAFNSNWRAGGTRLGGLTAAGEITELRPGAVAALSAAMWWDPAPWAPTIF